jgi:chromosome segregation ATPase
LALVTDREMQIEALRSSLKEVGAMFMKSSAADTDDGDSGDDNGLAGPAPEEPPSPSSSQQRSRSDGATQTTALLPADDAVVRAAAEAQEALRRERDAWLSEREDLERTAAEARDAVVAEFATARSAWEGERGQLQLAVTELRAQLEAQRSANDGLSRETAALRSECSGLSSDRANLASELQAHERARSDALAAQERAVSECAVVKRELDGLRQVQADAEVIRRDRAFLSEELERARAEREELERRSTGAQDALAATMAQVEALSQELEAEKQRNGTLDVKVF